MTARRLARRTVLGLVLALAACGGSGGGGGGGPDAFPEFFAAVFNTPVEGTDPVSLDGFPTDDQFTDDPSRFADLLD
jgi:hypothetical protein